MASIDYRESHDLPRDSVLRLYQANDWSAANHPEALASALANSHALVSAWDEGQLVGLGNAISDGSLVVYYPHLLVLPEYQGKGIGRRIMEILKQRYAGFHQHVLIADGDAIEFYKRCGFKKAGRTESMWIYAGGEH